MNRPPPMLVVLTLAVLAFNVLYANTLPDVLQDAVATHPLGYFGKASPATQVDVAFVDVTAQSGVDARRQPWGDEPSYPLILTGGAAAGDVDGDGWTDLYFPPGGEGSPARLYRNLGAWRFEDITAAAGLGATGVGAGAGFADMDNDGDADLAAAIGGTVRLWRNDGGRFTDLSASAGVDLTGKCRTECLPSSLLWTDADRDGWLDLFVVNNLEWRDPNLHSSGSDYTSLVAFGRAQRTVLLVNQGDGTFADQTLDLDAWSTAKGLGATASDLDGDGTPEILTANDVTPNAVLRWDGGRFRDVATLLRADEVKSSMGIQAADLTGDGRPEIVVSNLRGDLLSLLVQREDGTFRHETTARGLQGTGSATGWGVALFDADLDGWLDVAHAAGRPAPLGPHERDIGNVLLPRLTEDSADQLFRNLGDGRFGDATASAGFGDGDGITRGLLAVDLDNDGDEDVVRVQLDGQPAQLLRNDRAGHATSLSLAFEGAASNRDGFGARVEVLLPDGRVLVRELVANAGYQTGLAPRLTIGLGGHAGADVTVHWPSGQVQQAGTLAAGAHRLMEPR